MRETKRRKRRRCSKKRRSYRIYPLLLITSDKRFQGHRTSSSLLRISTRRHTPPDSLSPSRRISNRLKTRLNRRGILPRCNWLPMTMSKTSRILNLRKKLNRLRSKERAGERELTRAIKIWLMGRLAGEGVILRI